LALASAALFGASTPLAKLLLDQAHPWMLAGLLYLGSGFGLLAIHLFRRRRPSTRFTEAPISRSEWLWLGAAIVSGGVIGPVLLMFGLAATPASSASLLLNLEGVFTALLAWFVFREHFDRRIALGMVSIIAGAVVLSWQGAVGFGGLFGPIAIMGACFAWAFDNNLTRKVSLSDPVQIAMLKGLVAGSVNLVLASAQGAAWPSITTVAAAGVVGLFGYGFSLVLFILALRHIGTARTGAYFSTAPFIGAAIAIVGLGEQLSILFAGAALLMAFGVWLHLTERHEHEHGHERLTHTHRHVHDIHHHHEHGGGEPAGEPHVHLHVHKPLWHHHPHYPDIHHRHEH
jgi:drug/metabolite transporter (DMT)-like permease